MTDNRGAPFAVRPLEPHDRVALEAMYVEFEPKRSAQGLPPAGAAALQRWLDRTLPLGRHLVVEVSGRVLGHAMLVPVDACTVELANFLHQSIRSRGIGTALNRIALEEARRAGLGRVWLSVEPSVRSYEKAGFRRLAGSLWAPEIEMEAALGEPPAESSA